MLGCRRSLPFVRSGSSHFVAFIPKENHIDLLVTRRALCLAHGSSRHFTVLVLKESTSALMPIEALLRSCQERKRYAYSQESTSQTPKLVPRENTFVIFWCILAKTKYIWKNILYVFRMYKKSLT